MKRFDILCLLKHSRGMKRGIRLYDLQSLRKGNKQAIDKRQERRKKERKENKSI